MEEESLRFRGLDWFPEKFYGIDIVVGGCGGIGSWLFLFLAKAGYNLRIIDPDTVEIHNLGGQFFWLKDIGQFKVHAVGKKIRELGCKGVYQTHSSRVQDDMIPVSSYFSAFDNMDARKSLFNYFKHNPDSEIFIDGRLEAENFQVFCVRKDDEEAMRDYEENYLFDSADVEDIPCSMKQTSHVASMIASIMVSIYNNYKSNQRRRVEIRDVPFMTTFSAPAFVLKTARPEPAQNLEEHELF